VTQQFDDLDYYWSNADPDKAAQKHRATDIGNTRCGDTLVAMLPSTVTRIKDNATDFGALTDALGLRMDCGWGLVLEYWHLNGYLVASGARVAAGQPVGVVGKTGLGNVCHTHITGRLNGVLFDVEDMLFGVTLAVGEDDDDMNIPPGTRQIAQGVMAVGNGLYAAPNLSAEAITLTKTEFVAVYATAQGEEFQGSTDWLLVGWGGRFHFAVASLVKRIGLTSGGAELIPTPAPAPADCSQPVADAIAGERTRWEQWLAKRP
jgi:hypothetical protein